MLERGKVAWWRLVVAIGLLLLAGAGPAAAQTGVPPGGAENREIAQSDCTAEKIGSSIPVSAIGEPVSGVTLEAPVWTPSASPAPAYCTVNGSMAPVSREPSSRPINFRVVLPASWSRRAVQLGGRGLH